MNADKIVVLSKGKLLEEGTHRDLLKSGGQYALMWNKQFPSEEKLIKNAKSSRTKAKFVSDVNDSQ